MSNSIPRANPGDIITATTWNAAPMLAGETLP